MKKYIIYFLLLGIITFFLIVKKEHFMGQLSPLKRNMSYDLRCEPEIKKQPFVFNNSTIDYYIRPKCLKTI